MEVIQIEFDLTETEDWIKFKNRLELKMVEELKLRKLYRENLLYRGFDYSKLKRVIKTGDDHSNQSSYAGNEQHIWYNLHEVINYAWFKKARGIIARIFNETNRFGIAVYDSNLLSEPDLHGMTKLGQNRSFKEALMAIFIFIPA